MTYALGGQFANFAIVGGLGFLVDAGVLWLAMEIGMDFHAGRVMSFLSAASFTWLLNRRHTFRPRTGRNWLKEWLCYLLAMLVGGAVNLGASFACYRVFDVVRQWPVLAVAAGATAGMLINFFVARRFVFR